MITCKDCESDKIENYELQLCASCNAARRKAERQAKKVQVVKPIKKVSEKRADELKEYPKLKKNFLLHKMACEVKLTGCTTTATQIHHCSLSAKNFLNTDTWAAVCSNCHGRIEKDIPAEQRRKMGLLTD